MATTTTTKTWTVIIKAQEPMCGNWDNWKYTVNAPTREEAKKIAIERCGLVSITRVSASAKR